MIDSLLFAVARISTFDGDRSLTAATGFFYEEAERLFLVTSHHVMLDEATGHRPNRISLTLHTDADNLTKSKVISMWLYEEGHARWRQGGDSGGDIDVAVLEMDREEFEDVVIRAFDAGHLLQELDGVDIGTPLLIVGFPLGFFDTVHRLPVARQATVASAFGVRFQQHGYFLTDARMHRGASGSPVVMRQAGNEGDLPWKLLGIHSARLDMNTREKDVDESLGLNCAWYADILPTLVK